MNYEQYKEMISEEAEATESIFAQIIISGVCVNKNDKDGLICFLSKNAKKCLSPTIYSILTSRCGFSFKVKLSVFYVKRICFFNFFDLSVFLIHQVKTCFHRVIIFFCKKNGFDSSIIMVKRYFSEIINNRK